MSDTDRTRRLAEQLSKQSGRQAMAVILRNVPPSYNWGFYSREEPRMHLQVVDPQHRRLGYKVWLEERGRRVFLPLPGIPAKVLKSLQQEVSVSRRRDGIEHEWVDLMIQKQWLSVRLEWPLIRIFAYPGTPNAFERQLNLLADFSEEFARIITPEDVVLNEELACLELLPDRHESRRPHIRLQPILWTDA
jgi:hypothetical protein